MKTRIYVITISIILFIGLFPFSSLAAEMTDGPSQKTPEPKEEIVDLQKEANEAEDPATKKKSEAPKPGQKESDGKESIEKIKAGIQERNNKEIIYFAVKSNTLDENAKKVLNKMAMWLKAHPDVKLIIEGHGNEYKTSEQNLMLGELRAGSVISYLLNQGISETRLTVVSYGSERSRNSRISKKYGIKNWRVCFLVKKLEDK